MSNLLRRALALSTTCVAIGALAACGGGGSANVVAQVGADPITKASVSHWMATLAGGDYYQLSGKRTIPEGLVSEPPNYARCVARLEAAAASAPVKSPTQTGVALLTKCRQLYQALRTQAVGYLVSARWFINLAREEGLTATDAEVTQLYNEIKAREFPKPAELRQYLASRRLSLADELFVVKLDVLSQKVQRKLASGGKQAIAKFTEAGKKWTAKTTCHAGYVVEHCKEYTGQTASSVPAPSVLMEQVAVVATGRCINLAACPKQ
jgi:hypothetical protein